MFFHWRQNNSGGFFEDASPLAPNLVIEADSYKEAEENALAMGVYYDGVQNGYDCGCCGDRWYEGDELEVHTEWITRDYGYGFPERYDVGSWSDEPDEDGEGVVRTYTISDLKEYATVMKALYGFGSGVSWRIHYKDGSTLEV